MSMSDTNWMEIVRCEPTGTWPMDDAPAWRLDRLRAAFDECHELREGAFWALVRRRGCIVEVSFMEFLMSDDEGVDVAHLLTVMGPSDGLREARHSYWGPEANGYVYYMNFNHVRDALVFLERYFDGE